MNKDFNFFQKHTEKLVLGVCVLLLFFVVAYAWLGVLGAPHTTADGDTPNDIEDEIRSTAERVRARLNSDDTGLPTREEYIVPPYAEEFSRTLAQPITQVAELPAKPDTPGLPDALIGQALAIAFDPVFLPTPPVASSFSVVTRHGVLADPSTINDPVVRNQLAEVQQIVGDEAPVDFQYVSVMAEFPLREWAERLDAPDRPRNEQIPDNVWLSKLGLASVYLVREEQADDGTWGNRTVIEPLPGQIAFLPDEQPEQIEPLAAQQRLAETQELQPQIVQPAFPPMALEVWTPPTGRDRVRSPEDRERLNDLETAVQNAQRRLDRLTGRDDRENRSTRNERPSRNQEGMRGMGGMGDFDMGGATRNNRGNRGDAQRDREAQQIQQAEERLLEAMRELNEFLGIDDDSEQMSFLNRRGGMGMGMGMGGMDMGMGGMDMGMGMEGMGDPRMRGGMGSTRGRAANPALNAGVPGQPTEGVPETIRMWAHDLTAQPGKTYRYKLVGAAINPLYQYTRLPADQREANEFRLALPPSDQDFDAAPWTAAVTLDPEAYFFFVRGNADQDRATVEVWQVYNGQWRQGQFEETPGNPIGGDLSVELVPGVERTVNLGVDAVLLDVDVAEVNGTARVRMVYLLDDGTIASRLLNLDRNDDKREELERIAEEQRQSQGFAFRQ